MRLLSLSSRLLIDEQETNLFRRCPDCRRLVNVLAIASSLDRVLTSTLLHGRLLYRRRMRERAAVTTSTSPRSMRSTSSDETRYYCELVRHRHADAEIYYYEVLVLPRLASLACSQSAPNCGW